MHGATDHIQRNLIMKLVVSLYLDWKNLLTSSYQEHAHGQCHDGNQQSEAAGASIVEWSITTTRFTTTKFRAPTVAFFRRLGGPVRIQSIVVVFFDYRRYRICRRRSAVGLRQLRCGTHEKIET